ncbi:MAG TPA: asparagine synthase C-terminal domain-containing protein [Steroidobacteraceae bacterium]|jgi:asparagine synthase (glutamine-hydrolysing)
MFRYVALIWNAQDPRQIDAAQAATRRLKATTPQWHEALDRAGLRVLCTDIQPGSLEPRPLAASAGVLLGSLFTRNSDPADETPARACALDETRTAAITDSRGEWLVRNTWGNYVAFIRDPLKGSVHVLKDPCGSLPCFCAPLGAITVIFSAIADVVHLGPDRFTVNRRYVERRLYGGDMTHQWNALNEVTQIRRGERAEFNPRQQPAIVARRFLWSPFEFAQAHERLDESDVAAAALRGTLHSCTATLAACHEDVLMRISGGLDSSIVLGCLRTAPRRPRLWAYTQYALEGALDPRRWARMAVAHYGCEHVEMEATAANVRLAALLEMAPTAEPFTTLMHLATIAHEQALVSRHPATATFTGDGGDAVFGSFCIGEAAATYLRRHGPRPAVLRLAAESALVLGETSWHVLSRALRTWITGRSPMSMDMLNTEARRLVPADVIRECEANPAVHPWLAGKRRVPWEAVSKLGMLLAAPDLYAGQAQPGAAGPEIIAPIYAQPMIEVALRIPADVLFAGGQDRGLARRAFRGAVPQPILDRIWKDRAGGFHDELIQRNRDWLREMFLDGVLVSEGLLDRVALERALAPGVVKSDVFPGELLRHLDTEIWARQWQPLRKDALRAA